MQLRRDHEEESVEVPMTPMIDCVFLLLIFFLVTASLKKPHKELEINLPHAAAAKIAKATYDEVIISLDRKGNVYVDGSLMKRTALLKRLQHEASRDAKPKIRIDGDRMCPYYHVAEVLNLCQLYGLNAVAFKSADNVQHRRNE